MTLVDDGKDRCTAEDGIWLAPIDRRADDREMWYKVASRSRCRGVVCQREQLLGGRGTFGEFDQKLMEQSDGRA